MKKFIFWRNNAIDARHEKTEEELKKLFLIWLPKKTKKYLEYYGSEGSVRGFLSIDKEGLTSTFGEDQYQGIYKVLRPVYMEFLYPEKAV